MVLHYAHLCAVAGGVDAFLIGSEMPGLTTIRSGPGTYPAVQAYRDLAGDVRSILGAETAISYAADWSEHFGHQPSDGSGDVFFHLDPLVLCCRWLPSYDGATARHAIYGGQWRRLDRCQLGRDGPLQSVISRRLPQGPERIRVRQITHDKHRTQGR